MPYAGPDDPKLPPNIKSAPANVRKRWVGVWNSAYNNCKSPAKGGGPGKDCEGVAFRMANGVAKKEYDYDVDAKADYQPTKAEVKAALEAMIEGIADLEADEADIDDAVEELLNGKRELAELAEGEKAIGPIIRSFSKWAGGKHRGCVAQLRGKSGIENPAKLCAWLKDRATGTTTWRGGKEDFDLHDAIDESLRTGKSIDEIHAEKVGAVLNKRNREQLKAALDQVRTVLKNAGVLDEDAAEKDYAEPVVSLEEKPYGGAQTFAELDTYMDTMEQEMHVREKARTFEMLVHNIMCDEDKTLDQKASAVNSVAAELQNRLASGEKAEEHEEYSIDWLEKAIRRDPKGRFSGSMGGGGGRGGGGGGGGLDGMTVGKTTKVNFGSGNSVSVKKDSSHSFSVSDSSGKSIGKISKGLDGTTMAIPAKGKATKMPSTKAAAQFLGARGAIAGKSDSLFDRIVSAFKSPKKKKRDEDEMKKGKGPWGYKDQGVLASTADAPLLAFKDEDGNYRWLTIYSNKFYDRQGEVFPEASHREFINWADRTKNYPELWLWHVPGSRIGQADMLDVTSDGMALASGTFDSEKYAKAIASDAKNLRTSHGYLYAKKDLNGGVYSRYRSFEITLVPAAKAANYGTAAFVELEEQPMLTAEKMKFLEEKLGADRAKAVANSVSKMAKDLESQGIGWKDLESAFESEEEREAPTTEENGDEGEDEEEEATETEQPAETPATEEEKPAEADTVASEAKGVKSEDLVAAVKEAITPLDEKLTKFQSDLDQANKAIEELRKTDDEKVAALMKAPANARAGVKSATESTENVTEGEAPGEKDEKGDGSYVAPHVQALTQMLGGSARGQD